MSIGLRIRNFIARCYGNARTFAKVADVPYTSISRYVKDKISPGTDVLLKFKQAGMSIDWLLDGHGSMFAKNDKGRELKKKCEMEEAEEKKLEGPYKRIIDWIVENYVNLENFSIITGLDYDEFHNFIYFGVFTGPELIYKLEKAGCSVNWLATGEGLRYANNPAGYLLEMRISDQATEAPPAYKNLNIDQKKIMGLHIDEFYQLIKNIIGGYDE